MLVVIFVSIGQCIFPWNFISEVTDTSCSCLKYQLQQGYPLACSFLRDVPKRITEFYCFLHILRLLTLHIHPFILWDARCLRLWWWCRLWRRVEWYVSNKHTVYIFRVENGDCMFVGNIGICLRVFIASQPKISSPYIKSYYHYYSYRHHHYHYYHCYLAHTYVVVRPRVRAYIRDTHSYVQPCRLLPYIHVQKYMHVLRIVFFTKCGPFGRPRRRWEDGNKMDLREIGWGGGGVEWIHLAQDRDRWRAVVSAVMNLRVLAPRSQLVRLFGGTHATFGNRYLCLKCISRFRLLKISDNKIVDLKLFRKGPFRSFCVPCSLALPARLALQVLKNKCSDLSLWDCSFTFPSDLKWCRITNGVTLFYYRRPHVLGCLPPDGGYIACCGAFVNPALFPHSRFSIKFQRFVEEFTIFQNNSRNRKLLIFLFF
jgi:hypothetical protein